MNRILPILFILAALAMFFLYIEPQFKGPIADSQQQISSYNRALDAAKAYEQKQDQLIAAKNQINSDDLNRLNAFLPDDVDNVQLILDLSSLASRTNMKLSSFAIADNSTTDNATGQTAASSTGNDTGAVVSSGNMTDSLDLSVTASGSYSDFLTFLAAAEQSLRPLDVTKLTITNAASGPYTYNVTFRLYWLH